MSLLSLMFPILAASEEYGAEDNSWEASFFGGGHFTGHVKLDSSTGHDQLELTNGSSFGVTAGKDFAEDSALEVMWTRQNSEMRAQGGSAAPTDLGSLTIDRYHFSSIGL